ACGPRFAIATNLPFDRPATTLAPFVPCAECAAEYADPADRRFHAQTLACPRCGPRVALLDARGREQPGDDPLARAAARLCAGRPPARPAPRPGSARVVFSPSRGSAPSTSSATPATAGS